MTDDIKMLQEKEKVKEVSGRLHLLTENEVIKSGREKASHWYSAAVAWVRGRIEALLEREPPSRSFRYLARQIGLDLRDKEGTRYLALACGSSLDKGAEIALMLAYYLGEELESRVLLVDATFRPDAISALFTSATAPGVFELLQDRPLQVRDLIQPTVHKNIDLLPLGRPDPASFRPTNRERVARILQDEAVTGYDMVIVQQGLLMQDTRYIDFAAAADMVLVQAQERGTPLEELDANFDAYHSMGIENVRLVLSEPD